jgi:hypothetical protein
LPKCDVDTALVWNVVSQRQKKAPYVHLTFGGPIFDKFPEPLGQSNRQDGIGKLHAKEECRCMPCTGVGVALAPAVLLLGESRGAPQDGTQRTGFSQARGNIRKLMKFGEHQRIFAREGGHVRD